LVIGQHAATDTAEGNWTATRDPYQWKIQCRDNGGAWTDVTTCAGNLRFWWDAGHHYINGHTCEWHIQAVNSIGQLYGPVILSNAFLFGA
jgi:hypothetical protein